MEPFGWLDVLAVVNIVIGLVVIASVLMNARMLAMVLRSSRVNLAVNAKMASAMGLVNLEVSQKNHGETSDEIIDRLRAEAAAEAEETN